MQNGIRGEILDVFKTLRRNKKFHVDYMLVFGNAIASKYQNFLKGHIVKIGSLKNNMILVEKISKKRDIMFISQYCASSKDETAQHWIDSDGESIKIENFYEAEKMVLRFLSQYCRKKGLELKICARSKENNSPEYDYFKKILENDCWTFIQREGQFDNYKLLDSVGVVVSIDSTLGYEALARGSKTACFSIRGFTLHSDATKFGWPANLPDNGPFWTNHARESEFERVMDYVTSVSDEEWEETRQKYIPDLMEFDPGNTKFLKLMKEMQVPLKKEYA